MSNYWLHGKQQQQHLQGRNCDLTVDADEGFILREITSDKVEIDIPLPLIIELVSYLLIKI